MGQTRALAIVALLTLLFQLGGAADSSADQPTPAEDPQETTAEGDEASQAPAPEAAGETREAPPPKSPDPITAASWGESVGFAPDLDGAPGAGSEISAANLEEWERFVPEGVAKLVESFALRLPISDYQPVHPSRGYIKATNRYRGEPTLLPDHTDARAQGIENYTAGLPFPQPQSGREIAYNYVLAYRGDDGTYHYGVYWISADRGVTRWEEWRWEFIRRAQFRTDLDPIPAFPNMEEDEIAGMSLSYAVSPQDKRGYASLYHGKVVPEDISAWVYLPPTRRVMQVVVGTKGDAWNSTDLLYEDIGGYTGHPEWMEWKLLEKRTILAPVHAEIPHGKQALREAFDFNTWPHWNLRAKWEPRPVYVVEARPRLTDYPYSRMLVYFDAETFFIPVKVAWDRQGRLWKVLINASNASPDMDTQPLQVGTALAVDLLSRHATAFPAYDFRANVGHQPSDFTVTRLRRLGR